MAAEGIYLDNHRRRYARSLKLCPAASSRAALLQQMLSVALLVISIVLFLALGKYPESTLEESYDAA